MCQIKKSIIDVYSVGTPRIMIMAKDAEGTPWYSLVLHVTAWSVVCTEFVLNPNDFPGSFHTMEVVWTDDGGYDGGYSVVCEDPTLSDAFARLEVVRAYPAEGLFFDHRAGGEREHGGVERVPACRIVNGIPVSVKSTYEAMVAGCESEGFCSCTFH
jgi:hypothetical protein